MVFDGTAGGLANLLKQDGIDRAVVLNTVTNERQVDKVNAFALETDKDYSQLIPFCSVHPLNDNIYEKLAYYKSLGIKGIKHHPDYVGIELDDPRTDNLLSAASELNMPVVIHTGYDPVSPNKVHASADAILHVLDKFPNLILVAAHLGGVSHWDESYDKLCGKNLYLDTAFCCERIGMTVEQGKRIFSKHPHDKILFGSDAPWASPSEVLEFIQKLGITDDSMDLILHKNASSLLRIAE